MQCPFLKDIDFKKISQINNDESNDLDCDFPSEPMETELKIPEENIDFDIQKSRPTHFIPSSSTIHLFPLPTSRSLHIKLPKQTKTRGKGYPRAHCEITVSQQKIEENSVEDEQLHSQTLVPIETNDSANTPQSIAVKGNFLNGKDQIFQGNVWLNGESEVSQCLLKSKKLKISRVNRVKCFIDLRKIKCSISIEKESLIITARSKNSIQKFSLQFAYSKQKDAFLSVFLQNSQNEKENAQNYSIDSLGFGIERTNLQELRQTADTFDILLFKNHSLASKMQRIFTNSDYDHVALVLRTSTNDLYLLEASSNNGVSIYNFDSIVRAPQNHYARLGIRHYQGQRHLSQIQRLQSWIKTVVGKKYRFDPMYLFSSEAKKEETYFCSQLVVEALKKGNILLDERPSYKYLPKHLAQDELNERIPVGRFSDVLLIQ